MLNIDNFMNMCFTSTEEVAKSIGCEIIDGKVCQEICTVDEFKKVLTEYVEEWIETGNNSSMVFESLAANNDEQQILIEMLLEG